mgnify:CR=1 FL=1|tara:strand:+ start:36600 stop:37448 length:849 start_codon:yes stop_codon:yes gene_type:complete
MTNTTAFTKWNQADHVIVSISGGKDSTVLMLEAEIMKAQMPNAKFHYVHAVIDIDWDETMEVVQAQCDHFGVELITVQAVDKKGNKKGFIDQLLSPRVNRKTKEVGEYLVPNMANRWCTSILKTGPIDKFARTLKGNVLVMIGERAQESRQRAALESWRPDDKNTLKDGSRNVVKFSPILDMPETEVWNLINANAIPTHPCYSWGVSRASCAICIFSSNKEIALAAEKAPGIVKKYILAEESLSTTFKYKPATKTRPEMKISLSDILESEGVDLEKLLNSEL